MVTELQQYGVSVMPLGDWVSNFCIEQGNDKRASYIKTMKHAEWAWKDMFRTTLWTIQTVVLQVDHRHTITLPNTCQRVINISVKDCHNRLHPLTCDTDLNTAEIRCPKFKCSCGKCNGQNTLCAALDAVTTTTETVIIHGSPYTMTSMVKMDSEGNVQTISYVPTWDVASGTVITTKQTTFLCNVETDEKGCIKSTKANIDVLNNFVGWNGDWFWNNSYGQYHGLMPAPYNYWGHYNFNAADPSIVHIFDNHCDTHNVPGWPNNTGNVPWGDVRSVIVTFQTNGEAVGEEILIPDYAYDAMASGVIYRQHRFSPRDGDPSGTYFRAFERDKMKVMKYLNPVRMEDIEKIQSNLRRW